MLEKADLIVKATVNEEKDERLLGICSSLKIERVVKGDYEKGDIIYVITLKGTEQLVAGETYVLALTGDNEDNTYSIMAGSQGRFYSSDGISIGRAYFLDEINEILSDINSEGKGVLDILCDGFSKRLSIYEN